jgi:hypothetical protein
VVDRFFQHYAGEQALAGDATRNSDRRALIDWGIGDEETSVRTLGTPTSNQ